MGLAFKTAARAGEQPPRHSRPRSNALRWRCIEKCPKVVVSASATTPRQSRPPSGAFARSSCQNRRTARRLGAFEPLTHCSAAAGTPSSRLGRALVSALAKRPPPALARNARRHPPGPPGPTTTKKTAHELPHPPSPSPASLHARVSASQSEPAHAKRRRPWVAGFAATARAAPPSRQAQPVNAE